MFFDPMYFLFIAPAFLLMLWAQARVKSAYSAGMQVPAHLTGAAAARHILDQAGLNNVNIEETGGMLSDHYDPSHRVLRLSHEVYNGRTAASVGIAAHEAGHALQHAQNYGPLVIRNLAVPAATWGPSLAMIFLMIGFFMQSLQIAVLGLIAYGGLVFFQLVNLPVEFDASARAKVALNQLGIVDAGGSEAVSNVLNAAGWTYVAATLQSVMELLYYVYLLFGRGHHSSDE
ncbi:zinc metallopeptidase [Lacunimicrobium album]